MGSQNQAAATFGAGTFLAFALVSLMSTSFVNQAVSLSLDPFLRLWAETVLAVVFAFVLLIAAFLIGSKTGMGSIVGGVLGTLVSIIGAINSIFLLSLTVGVLSSGGGASNFLVPSASAQLTLASELLFFMAIVVLVVGMPLVLVGSFQHMREHAEEGP